jgi:DNA adenine methylase
MRNGKRKQNTKADILSAPFAYTGSKSLVADEVWARFGKVECYVEPFFGSGAVLLGRPKPIGDESWGVEIANDIDCMIVNLWRAVKHDPDAVARAAVNPLFENDHHARHAELVAQRGTLRAKLEGDEDYCDPKLAGWWVWGKARMMSPLCSGRGPWKLERKCGEPRELVYDKKSKKAGISREFFLKTSGGFESVEDATVAMRALTERFKDVCVYCGDWQDPCIRSRPALFGRVALFLDPPYTVKADRQNNLYACESTEVGIEAYKWAVKHGNDHDLLIALCGYTGEYKMPDDWSCYRWTSSGGLASFTSYKGAAGRGVRNKRRECVWFNANCGEGRKVDNNYWWES